MKNILGKLIKLRFHEDSDVENIYKNIRDKEIQKYTLKIPFPYLKSHAIDFIKQTVKNRKSKIAYEFAITENDEDSNWRYFINEY